MLRAKGRQEEEATELRKGKTRRSTERRQRNMRSGRREISETFRETTCKDRVSN